MMKKLILMIVVFSILFFLANLQSAQSYPPQINENMAIAGLRSISVAIISYTEAHNGKFPTDFLADLVYVKPPYLMREYGDEEKDGYKYSVELYSDGYKIVATPTVCGQTGNKIFVLEARGKELNKVFQGENMPADLEIKETSCKY
ncbi:MAG: hypothetical protein ABIA97_03390 [Candidatus Omnitrophota bacterium]